jgi:hypothetical protein
MTPMSENDTPVVTGAARTESVLLQAANNISGMLDDGVSKHRDKLIDLADALRAEADTLHILARQAPSQATGAGEDTPDVIELPIDENAREWIQKAAEFLDAAAGEGLEIEDGGDAMEIVLGLHSLLSEDPNHCFHEDVARWLSGKIRPTAPEAPQAPSGDFARGVEAAAKVADAHSSMYGWGGVFRNNSYLIAAKAIAQAIRALAATPQGDGQ